MTQNLFIDITELIYWEGRLTGVPRVMNELSLRFLEEEKSMYVSWDKKNRAYRKVAFVPADISIIDGNEKPLVVPKKQELAENVKLFVRKSKYASRSVELAKTTVRIIRGEKNIFKRSNQIVTPTSGDTLLILADWHGSDPNFISYIKTLKVDKVRIAQVSYDLLPIVAPQYSGHSTKTFTRYVRSVYPIADLIISISKNTSDDIRKWLKKEKLRIPSIVEMRLGDDFVLTKSVQPKLKQKQLTWSKIGDYILCVGTVEARKNHTILYYTYKLAAARGIDLPSIIIVGRVGWLAQDIFTIITHDPDTKDKFIFLSSISDNELSWLYENCSFTIYPSFYEGWGLPIAESIKHGVPCLASDTSSIPEIAGNLINYFTPSSPEDCLRGIQELVNITINKKARKRVSAYKPTSWDSTANQVKKAIGDMYVK